MTRTRVAGYLAGQLEHDRSGTVRLAAAWLLSTGRRRQIPDLVSDVELALAREGYVVARVTVARPLSPAARRAVTSFLRRATGAKQLELTITVDPSVVGGVRIEVPGARLDTTVHARLTRLIAEVSR